MDYFSQNSKFSNKDSRMASYDFLENFLSFYHSNWKVAPNTEQCVNELQKIIKTFDNEEFSFLICHTGYIPESYAPDSSQETIFTKLIEALVMEWAYRLGFTHSFLPTQKSSKEDVTIMDETRVIVCDAKSFRLGRSQAAPNVKDVLKHADISKWLSAYPEKDKLGGLVTLPSQHDWKKGSDFYQYTTDKTLPTLCLNYEHLAFMLTQRSEKKSLISVLKNYGDIFPHKISKKENNREQYYRNLERELFSDCYDDWLTFKIQSKKIVSERVFHCVNSLEKHLNKIRKSIEDKFVIETDINKLRSIAIESEYLNQTKVLHKQLNKIKLFRTSSREYYEKP